MLFIFFLLLPAIIKAKSQIQNNKLLKDKMEEMEMYGKEDLFSKAVKAGKRTYFFDVKTTKNDEKYITALSHKDASYYIQRRLRKSYQGPDGRHQIH